MSYHMDEEINRKIIELLDILCQFERTSGRGSTLILIPHDPNEKLLLALNGKPVSKMSAAKSDMLYVEAFQKRKETLMTRW